MSVLQRWFDPAGWLTLVAEHRLESSPVVPAMLQLLLAQPLADHDLSSLRSFGSGGATLPPAPAAVQKGVRSAGPVLEGAHG